MSATYTAARDILYHTFCGYEVAMPTTYYLGVSTTAINADGSGATEPVGNGYARKLITLDNFAAFGIPASGSTTNVAYIFMNTLTGTWGTISHFFLADSISGSNIRFYDTLSAPIIPVTGEFILFAPGDLVLSVV